MLLLLASHGLTAKHLHELIIGRLPTAHVPRTLCSQRHMLLMLSLLLLYLLHLLPHASLIHRCITHDVLDRLLRDAGLILVGELRHVVDKRCVEVVRKHDELQRGACRTLDVIDVNDEGQQRDETTEVLARASRTEGASACGEEIRSRLGRKERF
ncbi:hypothetical protein BC629DRAFT_1485120 [Irpex lacteus]|nr:hypothetical protein BC629DRAFT_1485120 [Irpex lacteus]